MYPLARALASHILRVYNDSQLWTKFSENGLCFFRDNYSLEALGAKIDKLMSVLNDESEDA
jgi:glycosyltransferase involved in cell wall biosynthesis